VAAELVQHQLEMQPMVAQILAAAVVALLAMVVVLVDKAVQA
jgi:hypothetical protein